jgi:hypothetical protein
MVVLTLCTPALLPNCLLRMQGMQGIFLPLYFFITPLMPIRFFQNIDG